MITNLEMIIINFLLNKDSKLETFAGVDVLLNWLFIIAD